MPETTPPAARSLGTWQVTVAGVALVVASTTLVSDFLGWFSLGLGFAVALAVALFANLLLGLSVAELSTRYPRAGALYAFAHEGLTGRYRVAIGTFLALLFYCTAALAASGEITGGAYGLQALLGPSVPLRVCIVIMLLAALIPNLLGLRSLVVVNAIMLIGMLGVRWWIGIAGFTGLNDAGAWNSQNLATELAFPEMLTGGLSLAVWTFIGLEFVAPMAEEVGVPRRAMPRGIVLILLVVLFTTLIMGVGTLGVLPADAWAALAFGEQGCGGECVQLAAGEAMFGANGKTLMAVASVTATYGSTSVGMAATSRILNSLARDSHLGPLSRPLSGINRFNAPWAALLFGVVLLSVSAVMRAQVVDWIFTAGYVWVLLFGAYHILLIVIRRNHPATPEVFQAPGWVPWVGLVSVVFTLYYAFAELGHAKYGGRAVLLIGVVALLTTLFLATSPRNRPARTTPGV